MRKITATDKEGAFHLKQGRGEYELAISFVGYKTINKKLSLYANQNLGSLLMEVKTETLKEVTISTVKKRTEQKGDTTVFFADAYKVNKYSNSEDLVQKMPGLIVEDGKITAQGEDVKKILVDGRDFFGDDPNIALKNFPAEMVEKVEMYDEQTDQARLTGFDDGQTVKALNLVTKKDKRIGRFGKAYAGYGDDDKYIAGGSVNFFKGQARVSVLALSNNINQQNFSTEDILGVMNATAGGGAKGGRNRRGGGVGGRASSGGSRGGSSDNFLVGQQSGLSTTNSVGLNYNDKWGKRVDIQASYFFNSSLNRNTESSYRDYFLAGDSLMAYTDRSQTRMMNYNHRANIKMEWTINKYNTLIWIPSLRFQNNDHTNTSRSRTFDPRSASDLRSRLSADQDNASSNGNNGYTFGSTLLYFKRFEKPQRSLSFRATASLTNRDGERNQDTRNVYYALDTIDYDSISNIRQRMYTHSPTMSLSGNVSYTEPLWNFGALQASYHYELSNSDINKSNYLYDFANQAYYDWRDTIRSNEYESHYITQRAGLSYRYRIDQWFLNAGMSYQSVTKIGNQIFPNRPDIDQTFSNWLPNFLMEYKFSDQANVRFIYRASTTSPSLNDLQGVIDNTDPMVLKIGNPHLSESFRHSGTIRYNQSFPSKGITLMASLIGSLTDGSVAQATTIASRNISTITQSGDTVSLVRGQQLIESVNLDGNHAASFSFTIGFPITWIASNLNLNSGASYRRQPGMTNGKKTFTHTNTLSQGVVLGSNISEDVDFTLTYTYRYSFNRNTLQSEANANYLTQTASGRFNWEIWKGFNFNTSAVYVNYRSSSDRTTNSCLWSAGVGKRFLKDDLAELKFSCYDILNRDASHRHWVTDAYVEDSNTLTLGRYFMLSFTYYIRNFKV